VDWVQNDLMYTEFTTEITGNDFIIGAPLVFSKQAQIDTIGLIGAPVQLNASAFPNRASLQRVRRIVGSIFVQAVETWTTGDVREFAMRIGKYQMNPDAQAIVLNSPDYSMNSTLGPAAPPYIWADDRFLWERRDVMWFNTDAANTRPMMKINVDWRGVETLENEECIGFLIQNRSTSDFGSTGPIRIQTWLRTLCDVTA